MKSLVAAGRTAVEIHHVAAGPIGPASDHAAVTSPLRSVASAGALALTPGAESTRGAPNEPPGCREASATSVRYPAASCTPCGHATSASSGAGDDGRGGAEAPEGLEGRQPLRRADGPAALADRGEGRISGQPGDDDGPVRPDRGRDASGAPGRRG